MEQQQTLTVARFAISFRYELSQTGWQQPDLLQACATIEQQLKQQPEYPSSSYPPREYIFRALRTVQPKQVRVVIIGQDPYIGAGEACGFAFSIQGVGAKLPPSLVNILQEVKSCGYQVDTEAALVKGHVLANWTRQGVLLLNSALTVKKGSPKSHTGIWHDAEFVQHVLRQLKGQEFVALLWGNDAKAYAPTVQECEGSCISTTHPSPKSAQMGFLGSACFTKANEALKCIGQQPIDWSVN